MLVVMYAGLAPVQNKFSLFEAPIPIFIGAIALVGSLFWLVEVISRLKKLEYFYRLAIVFGFIASVGVQLIVAHALISSGYTMDSELIYQQSVKYAGTGSVDPAFIAYLQNSPNNIALFATLGGFFRTLHHYGIENFLFAAILLNVALMSLAQVLTFLTVKMLYGRTIAAVSMIFTFIFISLTMYVQIPYSDTLTIVFPILLLYLTLRFIGTNKAWIRVLLAGFIGAAAVVGYLLKPTVIIALIAISFVAAVALIAGLHKKTITRRGWLVSFACLATCISALVLTNWSYTKTINSLHILPYTISESHQNSLPMMHFIAMGLKTTAHGNTIEYGGYDDEQARTVASLPTKDEKIEYTAALAQERLDRYGPMGYANFLAHKANWILSDATFYAYGEGSNEKVVFVNHDMISNFLRSFMYIEGDWYVLFGNILQVFWMALLVLIASQLIVLASDKRSWSNLRAILPRLMIAGILLFLLVFEGRSRYLFLYVPIFIVAAMYTLQWFKDSNQKVGA